VLLDIAAQRGVERLSGGTAIHRAELEAVAASQGVEVRRGDVVILNTGWQSLAESDPQRFLSKEPGLDVDAAEYLASLGVVAVGSDTWGLEVFPNPDPDLIFPVHQVLLPKHGIYILENIRTEELAADRAFEFLFVLGQPRFVGAVQMVINPVAIR
jgi:kynurenine formamidase